MSQQSPLLFSYPTTWMFLDDQEHFLNAIELALPSDQPCRFWTNPNACLAYLNNTENRGLSLEAEYINLSNEDILVRFELDQIAALPTNLSRFSEISVLVADYSMPGMTGLELFNELADQNIKKILLTGVADEKLAVAAFNEGLIDRFVLKSDQQAMDKTLRFCHELARLKLEGTQLPIIRILPNDLRILFQHEGTLKILSKVIADKAICEYYFSSKPLGFFCLDGQGKAYFLALVTESLLADQMASLNNRDVPAFLSKGVPEAKFYTGLFEDIYLNREGDYDWEYNSVRLESIGAEQPLLYWGVHQEPPLEVDYDPSSCSLHAYLSEV